MSPLSNLQKRSLAVAARAAYLAWPGRAAFEAANPAVSHTGCQEAWRHVETGKATGGIQSLRECSQAHYGRILAHFQAGAGDEAGAARTRVRDADNDRRIARYKLDQELRARGLAPGYAAAICRTQYRCGLDEATAGQLWRLLYTVRSRRPAPKLQPPTTYAPNGAPF